ncbi:MAG: hypothetical protein AAF743_16945 [Planctomycetota bacterium]
MTYLATIDPWFVRLNLAEAVVWFVVAAVVAWRFRTWALAVILVAFGVSDIVETRTGAWYRPWWLLVWKAACVIGAIGLIWQARRSRNFDPPV